MSHSDRYSQARRVTLIGALVNALLGFVKLIGGYLFHSNALVADGVHSFSDLFADVMVLFASKYGSLDADASHPYGHQRIETAATFLLALFLILAGAGIAYDSVEELISGQHTIPNWWSIPIICVSILANELLFRYTRLIGKRINSQLIHANAWHHRSDAASSLVVLVGLVASVLGYAYWDVLAAALVGLMIIKMGWDYAWNSVKELVDTAVDTKLSQQIELAINRVDGVIKMHQLRSRFMGEDIYIDVHVLVAPKISVSEGHYIAQHVHHALMNQFPNIKDVTVHIDPEDDETSCPSLHLPNRSVINDFLHEVHMDFPNILFWNVHYLDGKMSLDIACSENFNQWRQLHERVTLTLKLQGDIEEVRLFSLHDIMHH